MSASSYRLNTTLQPVAAGVLAALAAREDLKDASANQVLERLLRDELERLMPGAWDRLIKAESDSFHLGRDVKERVAEVAELLTEMLAQRARVGA